MNPEQVKTNTAKNPGLGIPILTIVKFVTPVKSTVDIKERFADVQQ